MFDYNLFTKHYKAVSDRKVPVGNASLAVVFEKLGKHGRATVTIDGVACGSVDIPIVLRMISSSGMDVGRDTGLAVSDDYTAPFDFQGAFRRMIFEMADRSPRAERQAQAVQMAVDMARQ